MKRFLRNKFALSLWLILAPVISHAGAKPEHIEIGKAGFTICMSNFPETRETTKKFKNAGWRFLGLIGQFRAYTNAKNRVIAATAVTSAREQGCFAAVHKMTHAEAVAFAEEFLAQAKSVKLSEKTLSYSVREWTAVYRGHKVRFTASRSESFRIMRGASFQMVTE